MRSGQALTVYGPGIVNDFRPLIAPPMPALANLVAAINVAVGNGWVDLDDDEFSFDDERTITLGLDLHEGQPGMHLYGLRTHAIRERGFQHTLRMHWMLEQMLRAAAGVVVATPSWPMSSGH